MPRVPIHKALENTRLANHYGGWMYCDACGKTVAYLCYVTYRRLRFSFTCACGAKGSASLAFEAETPERPAESPPTVIKNRLCCVEDASPLLTIVEKNLQDYSYEVACAACGRVYSNHKGE